MTTTTHSHKHWTDKGGHVNTFPECHRINSSRLNGIWSVTEGIAALVHDIKRLMMLLGWQEPATAEPSG